MTDQPPQRTRLSKSKATASTSTIQTLEITTTAITNKDIDHSPSSIATEEDNLEERKPSRHHHHHHVRSPAFEAHSNLASPLPSPQLLEGICTDLVLPPPIATKGPSEAIVALQDAVNVSQNKKCNKRLHTLSLFESSFFSAALLIQWSNVMGPKVEKVWSVEPLEEETQIVISRQVLNGEMGRTLNKVEPKWIVLHRQAIICTAFLFYDPTLESLAAFAFVVPVRYLRNFSKYFNVLCDRVPTLLIEPLVKLRKLTKRQQMIGIQNWHYALNFFTLEKLAPFVKSVMDLESVSLPFDCVKTSHTILDTESKQLLNSPFIAKFVK
ncbi:hypothetical protein BD560DRAFT_90542 [Blakeslea trispora]|nr:hypothetical protein BD560DRAFT_90542 [Blakeslea trispora]